MADGEWPVLADSGLSPTPASDPLLPVMRGTSGRSRPSAIELVRMVSHRPSGLRKTLVHDIVGGWLIAAKSLHPSAAEIFWH